MPQLECKFAIGERVRIDGDGSIAGVIVGVEWRSRTVVRYEVSRICNADAKFTFFDEWRLEAVP